MYKLIISDDEGKTTVVPLIRDEVTIGRKEGNTIRLTDRNISRFHARVRREEDKFLIEDMKSLTGTKIGNKTLKAQSQAIAPGDKIAIGDYSLSIRTDVSTDVPMGKQMESGDDAGIGRVTPHARLVVMSDPVPGKEIDLTANLYVIGRSQEANCQIKDSSISRAHARIDLDAGQWTISDLDSFNGILVNGQKKDDIVLKAGDLIELGNVRIRFVAPGEPFDFDPEEARNILSSVIPPPPKKPAKPKSLFLILGVLAAVAAIAIVVVIYFLGDEETVEVDDGSTKALVANLTFDQLMEKGKDAMMAEDWASAAKLFALAQRKDPSSELAKERKEMAVNESDSLKNFEEGSAAEEQGDWKTAYAAFAAIPRSSQYYDLNHFKHVSARYCNVLVEEVQKAIEKSDMDLANEHFSDIKSMPEAPKECKKEASDLEAFLEAMSEDAGAPGLPKRPPPRPPEKQPPPPNPDGKPDDKPDDKPVDPDRPVNPYG